MRITGTLCFGLALVILVLYFQRRPGWILAEHPIEIAISLSVLVAAGVTITLGRRRRQDLTQSLEKSEQQTADSHDLLRTTLASIADAVIATDAKGIITFLNPAAKRLSGWAGDEAIGMPLDAVFAITNEYTGAVVENPATRVLREERTVGLANDTVLTSKDGRVIPVGDSSAPIRDLGGRVTGVVLVFRDLTARKKAEETQINLASIVESSEDAIIGERLDGTITSWNLAATRIFGYSAGEMLGSSIAALIPDGHTDDSFEILARIRRDEHIRQFETVRRGKAGAEITVALTISAIRNAAGRIVGASTIARDVSGLKRIQLQLLHAQKLECLGVLAGGVAHDFNNYLMAITANATLIQDEVPSGSAAANLAQNIVNATEQGARLTRQMLDYSGKGRFVVERLDLNKHIQDIASLFRASIAKDVELRLQLDASLPPIHADSGQILQLVTNLVLNGTEAIGSNGVVTISTSLQEVTGQDHKNLAGDPVPSGAYAKLEVQDTGSGMDEVTQARMFDPFFTTKFTGRGLGLAAVLGIVRGHKGEISVSSQPGNGTVFQVLFPVERESLALPVEAGQRVVHAKL